MRAPRTAPILGFALALALAAPAAATTPAYEGEALFPMQQVTGSMVLGPSQGLGDFAVEDRIWQFRAVPRSAAPLATNDLRINGSLDSTWNYDIHPSGQMPVPAWGEMRIAVPAFAGLELHDLAIGVDLGEGAWVGDFTGIRYADHEPFNVRAFLMGEGAYEGLCATLDIEAGDQAWMVDGVIHPVDMAG